MLPLASAEGTLKIMVVGVSMERSNGVGYCGDGGRAVYGREVVWGREGDDARVWVVGLELRVVVAVGDGVERGGRKGLWLHGWVGVG